MVFGVLSSNLISKTQESPRNIPNRKYLSNFQLTLKIVKSYFFNVAKYNCPLKQWKGCLMKSYKERDKFSKNENTKLCEMRTLNFSEQER